MTSATIVACVVLYRAILLQSAPLWRYMPLPFFRPYDMVSARMMHSLAHRSFLSLGASLSPLCLGVLAALAVTNETCRQTLIRSARQPRPQMICMVKEAQSKPGTSAWLLTVLHSHAEFSLPLSGWQCWRNTGPIQYCQMCCTAEVDYHFTGIACGSALHGQCWPSVLWAHAQWIGSARHKTRSIPWPVPSSSSPRSPFSRAFSSPCCQR